ncbi:MAG: YkgJ family cysteine cluster protein [Candidatus Woesearchaeota archaeon]
MTHYKCNLSEECKRCGNCCRFHLAKSNLSPEEELELRKAIYYKKSILYLFDLRLITISIKEDEKIILEEKAKELNIDLKIKPNKILFDEKIKVLDYFILAEVCPFFDEDKNECKIYPYRPKICRDFPLNREKIILPEKKPKISFEKAIEIAKKQFNI